MNLLANLKLGQLVSRRSWVPAGLTGGEKACAGFEGGIHKYGVSVGQVCECVYVF